MICTLMYLLMKSRTNEENTYDDIISRSSQSSSFCRRLNETKNRYSYLYIFPIFGPSFIMVFYAKKRSFRGNHPPEVWQFALSQRAGTVRRPRSREVSIDPVNKTNTSQDHPNYP